MTVVRKLLRKHNYRRRKAQKKQTLKSVAHRDEQFAKIAAFKANMRIVFDTLLPRWNYRALPNQTLV
jgi:hypothetical protein